MRACIWPELHAARTTESWCRCIMARRALPCSFSRTHTHTRTHAAIDIARAAQCDALMFAHLFIAATTAVAASLRFPTMLCTRGLFCRNAARVRRASEATCKFKFTPRSFGGPPASTSGGGRSHQFVCSIEKAGNPPTMDVRTAFMCARMHECMSIIGVAEYVSATRAISPSRQTGAALWHGGPARRTTP